MITNKQTKYYTTEETLSLLGVTKEILTKTAKEGKVSGRRILGVLCFTEKQVQKLSTLLEGKKEGVC